MGIARTAAVPAGTEEPRPAQLKTASERCGGGTATSGISCGKPASGVGTGLPSPELAHVHTCTWGHTHFSS